MSIVRLFGIYGLLVCLCFGATSCQKELPTGVLGQWNLDGLYYDIGDGTGQFQSFKSNLVLIFEEDGVVHSNGQVCLMASMATSPSSGRYDAATGIITFTRCNGFDREITLRFTQLGDELLLNRPGCGADCGQRYIRYLPRKGWFN